MSRLPDVSMFDIERIPYVRGMNIKVSFSGGKTSALLAAIMHARMAPQAPLTVFANTGQEHPKTLDFVHEVSVRWGINTRWIEADVSPEHGTGTTWTEVCYETASRAGEPFEAVIRKYGLPGIRGPFCTRELKATPIKRFGAATLKGAPFYTAIGIRADEADRVSEHAAKNRLLYPLVTLGITKEDVRDWWAQQDFRLEIPEHVGNCVWCYKKSDRKLFTLLKESPEFFDFPERMEQRYEMVGSSARKSGLPQRFFRRARTVADLRREASAFAGMLYTDPNWHGPSWPMPDEDLGGGCGESCEVGADNDFDWEVNHDV
jgi:PP-loop superfamily ATP-utilizing enzyme